METLLRHKDCIFDVKKKVDEMDNYYYTHLSIENNIIDENTISIVMTASNRSKQTYFTLNTISKSVFKNVQVIIVDDSDIDLIDIDTLKNESYKFSIDLIKINRENKNWHNPLVNYNIGFKFIKGGKVVIQNAEVCHIGDVLKFIDRIVVEDNYYVFDVNASLNYETNEIIYNSDISSIDIYNNNLFHMWYQSINNNRNYHFLTSLKRETFNKINSFSYDCTMGKWYDDDDFLLKIISRKINIVNIFHNEHNIGGIHLFHGLSGERWDKGVEGNIDLFYKKRHFYNVHGIYNDITENIEDFSKKYEEINNS